jgi:predicted O-methyltransferase YrrM
MTEMLQVMSEFDQLAEIYRTHAPRRVLEIGVYMGGTLRTWLDGPQIVVAVDNLHLNRDAYPAWTDIGAELIVIQGVSQDSNTIARIREHAPYDFAFIDADHGYGSVKADADTVLPLMAPGGLLAFHDLVSDTGAVYGPGMVVNELEAAGYSVERFIDLEPSPVAHGIGLIRL